MLIGQSPSLIKKECLIVTQHSLNIDMHILTQLLAFVEALDINDPFKMVVYSFVTFVLLVSYEPIQLY